MDRSTNGPRFEHRGAGLLRGAAITADDIPRSWPDPTDTASCRAWLRDVWDRPSLVDAVRLATPDLAARIEAICDGKPVSDKRLQRATLSTVRYLSRAIGRHTPFGLFAGAAPAAIERRAKVRWGDGHRAVVQPDTQWLSDIIERLESFPELLDRLDVMTSNLVVHRGTRIEVPHGQGRATVRCTKAVQFAIEAAASPIGVADLADKLTTAFPSVTPTTVRRLLDDLVRQGVLISNLRAPLTVTDPLNYLIDRLNTLQAETIPAVAPLLSELQTTLTDLHRHTEPAADERTRSTVRVGLVTRMRGLSDAGRVPLAVNLRLDCDVQLPESVAHEMERAASALMRLTRQPTGAATWRDYYTAFCERYGAETLVPIADVVHPEAGIGLPATYAGSVMSEPVAGSSARDEKLLALAWQALADGADEIVLNDETITSLTVGDPTLEPTMPPHVELAARIEASDVDALQQGNYTLVVHPARAAGTLSSRFAPLVPEAGLDDVYASVPVATAGALPVQLSFPPLYPHAENICRIPRHLPYVLSLGEHRNSSENVIPLDDLAITATHDGLRLVSLSRQRVIEPQVFHALALDKQPPPLARFLAHLSRASSASWHEFDWGPHAQNLPYLPRVRYRRSILSPARWRLTRADLTAAALPEWTAALDAWRQRWRCPSTVELVDADRSLPLDLSVPAHIAIVRAHMERHDDVTLVEGGNPEALGWIDGRAHDVVLPLVSTQPPEPSPLRHPAPLITNAGHGMLPGAPNTSWLFAKVYTHPERIDELLARHLPEALEVLGQPDCWFARYRSRHETDHLRLRIRVNDCAEYGATLAALGGWAQQLRSEGLAGRLTIDTYYPETGRYGHGSAMLTAEKVFVADSHLVITQLQQLDLGSIHPSVLTAVNMFATVEGFLGSRRAAADWLTARPAPAATADRILTGQVVDLTSGHRLGALLDEHPDVAAAWPQRADSLAAYRDRLAGTTGLDAVLESLLHMHHNRALGIDRDGEAVCRRMARQAALAWQAQAIG